MNIRVATPDDAEALSRISMQAKANWGYSRKQLEIWRSDIAVDRDSVRKMPTYVVEINGRIAGFYQLQMNSSPPELDHLWVDPDHMKQGIGRALVKHALALLASRGVKEVAIDADPNAENFYASIGARRVGLLPAPIEGHESRVRPQLRLETNAT